jgi:hypothetical protein
MSKHTGVAGFVGHVKLVTQHPSYGSRVYADADFAFTDNAPYNVNGETPVRGNVPTYQWVSQVFSNPTEFDSLDVKYPTVVQYPNNQFGGTFQAEAYVVVPVVYKGGNGRIVGPTGALPGQVSTFRVIPYWDTTAYNFTWSVNGSSSPGDTWPTVTKSFASTGTYTLQGNQGIPDGSILSTTTTVKVFNGSISGPTNVRPFTTCEWSASASAATAPYTYSWQAVSSSGSGQYFDFTNGVASGGSFVVQLTVTDASGAQIFVNRNVNVNSSAPACIF